MILSIGESEELWPQKIADPDQEHAIDSKIVFLPQYYFYLSNVDGPLVSLGPWIL